MPENNADQSNVEQSNVEQGNVEQRTEAVRPETMREKFAREQEARRRGLKKYGITSGFWDFMTQEKPLKATRPAAAPSESIKPETEWVRFERGQVSRRAALKKMGVTTGMALFAMFSVDDLARMVGKAMEQRAGDNKIAEQIAREFSEMGIALAGGGPSGYRPCNAFENGTHSACADCNNERQQYCVQRCPGYQCAAAFNASAFICDNPSGTYAQLQQAWAPYCQNCLENCS